MPWNKNPWPLAAATLTSGIDADRIEEVEREETHLVDSP
jgi:hypothetical protein